MFAWGSPAHLRGTCRVAPVKELLWRMRWHSTSLALCFAVTIAVFPSITASICSVHNPARRPPCLPHTPYGRLSGVQYPPAAPRLTEVAFLQTGMSHLCRCSLVLLNGGGGSLYALRYREESCQLHDAMQGLLKC